ncbi:MAG: substrate-binding domain-containing protein [Candidatus Dormibacteria bacterium]
MAELRPSRRPPLPGAVEAGRRLRLARLGAGLSQAQLAQVCEVSRQALAGAEAGAWSPSLAVALRLARALDTTVDHLFAGESQPERLAVSSLGFAPHASRARVARVWDRWVALPLLGDGAGLPGFRPANGNLEPGGAQARRWGAQPALVVAGCDPALGLLAGPLAAGGAGWALDWWPCGSAEALRLLREGLVHAATVHYPATERQAQSANSPFASIGFARWREGLVFRPPPAPPLGSVGDAVGRRLRWVNREPGAEARELLDQALAEQHVDPAQLPGYQSEAPGHFALAGAIACGSAEVGVGSEPVALAFGLGFLPLSEEESVLRLERSRLESPELRLLLEVVAGPLLRRELQALPGYDAQVAGADLSP